MPWYTCGMAATPSTMLPLGTAAPPFALPDGVSGATISLETFADKKALLVMYLCRHCKYVQHVKQALTTLGKEYQGADLGIVAISANDATAYAQDAPDSLKVMAATEAFTFPLCYDETQAVAKAYTAACTPDFFFFDQQSTLVYRGRLDASRPGNQIPVTGKICGQPSKPSWQISPSIQCRSQAWAVTSNGKRAMNRRISSANSCGLLCVV
jgi:peroxiredoxin